MERLNAQEFQERDLDQHSYKYSPNPLILFHSRILQPSRPHLFFLPLLPTLDRGLMVVRRAVKLPHNAATDRRRKTVQASRSRSFVLLRNHLNVSC